MAHIDPLVAQLDPSIKANVANMIDGASTRYHVHIRPNQTKRPPWQAQTFHVLHMYLHNYFPHLRPRVVAADGRTIRWDHFKDPTIRWLLIDDIKSQFLRGADGRPATLVADIRGGKKWAIEPEESASTHAITVYLNNHGVSSMAAPGHDGCGEPCLCGGHASKHVSGKACDLSGLEELGHRIRALEPDKYASSENAVDQFLHGYHLWRPLAHLKGKAQELWHVEALPLHIPKATHEKHRHHAHHHAVHARHRGHHAC
jgi:hypothetical protein